ncbi:MAG: hypothetical protein PVG22_07370, partial [Chromatiales bacterium]
ARIPDAILLARFVGATPQSMTAFELLSSLCRELAAQFHIEQTVPGSFDDLLRWYGELIAQADGARPLLIFLDAINQLQAADLASDLQWLAQPLPPHVSLIVSTLCGHPLEAFLSSNIPDLQSHCLEGMHSDEGRTLLGYWLEEENRSLTDGQHNLIMQGFNATHSPLYLRLAFVESLNWRSFDTPKPLPRTIDALIDTLYERLSDPAEHGEVLVSGAISYLLGGRQGLSEQELKALLSDDPVVMTDIDDRWRESAAEKLPDVLWSRLRASLEPYLIERNVHRTTTLDFFHPQFRSVFERRLYSADHRKTYHARLATYFKGLPVRLIQSGAANSRRAFELPYQLASAARFDECYRTLSDFDFLQAKTEALGVHELLVDFDYGFECGLTRDRAIGPDQARGYALVRAALELSAHVVGTDPEQLASQLLGRLSSEKSDDIRHLCDDIRQWSRYAWFHPRARILNAPGGALLRIHQASSEALALVKAGSGELVAATASDHSIKLWALESGRLWRTLYGHGDMPRSLAATADGRRLVSVAEDKTLKLWNPEQSRPIASLSFGDLSPLAVGLSPKGDFALCAHERHPLLIWRPHASLPPRILEGPSGLIRALAVSSDGSLGASVGWDQRLWVWDLHAGRLLHKIDDDVSGEALAMTPDGQLALLASDDGGLHLWDLMAVRRVRSFAAHDSLISAVAITPDGRIGVSGSRDRLVKVWDLGTGGLLATLRGHTEEVGAIAIDPLGRTAVSADRIIAISDIDGGEIGKVYGCDNSVDSLAISPDGRRVVYVSSGEVGALDLATGEPDEGFLCDPDNVNHLAFAGNGMLVTSGDGILQTWRYGSADPLQSLESAVIDVGPVAVSADAGVILAAGTRFPLKVWDLDSGDMLRQLEGHTRYVRRIAITPDAKRAVSVSWDDSMRVWDLETGEALATVSRLGITGEAMAVSPDGRTVVIGMDDNSAQIWDLNQGQAIGSLAGHSDSISSVAFLPDGKHVATASRDGTARIWNLASAETIRVLRGHSNGVNDVAVSKDGNRLVTTSLDGTVRVWNLDAGDTDPEDAHHRDFVRAVRISRDGSLAVSCSDDGTLKSWDLTSGRSTHTFSDHRAEVWAIELSPDDLHLLSGARDGTLMLWHLPTNNLVQSIQAHDEALTHISLSADGLTAVTCAYDNTMKAWGLPSCALLKTFHGDDSFLTKALITQDGRFAVGGTMEGALLVGDIQGPESLRRLVGHPESVEDLVLIPGLHQLLSCGLNHDRMHWWDLDAGRILKTFGTDGHYYESLAVSADGQRLVATCTDTYKFALEVWELESAKLITRLEAFHADRVSALELCHNDHWALSASADHTIRLWDLERAAEIATFTADGGLSCAAATRNGSLVVAGSEAGVVHVLALEGQPYAKEDKTAS